MTLGPDDDTPAMGTRAPSPPPVEDPCKRCGKPATMTFIPIRGTAHRSCDRCAGVPQTPPHRALWVLERELSPGDWRPVPGASGPNEHAARNLAQALLLTTPGLSADTYRVQRYVPAPDGDE